MPNLHSIRGVTCPYCGHNTRMFSPVCGKCYERKPTRLLTPIYALRTVQVVLPLLVLFALYWMMRPAR